MRSWALLRWSSPYSSYPHWKSVALTTFNYPESVELQLPPLLLARRWQSGKVASGGEVVIGENGRCIVVLRSMIGWGESAVGYWCRVHDRPWGVRPLCAGIVFMIGRLAFGRCVLVLCS